MWFKKNLLVLLVGAIVGAIILSAIGYPLHLNSKKSQKETLEKQLADTKALLKDCYTKGIKKDTYTNNNAFNPNIGKNKKGVIEINTFPDIDQTQEIQLPLNPSELIKENMSSSVTKQPPDKKKKRKRRGKGNW